ncbi:MAG: non-ribosomal peptide synthetase, partial [bacterium]|nr:non-ribosomal peptide synthetase [bacterium]
MTEVFKHPTVRTMAGSLAGTLEERFDTIPAVETREYYPASSAQKRLYILKQMEPEGTGYNMPVVLRIEGLLNKKKLAETFKTLIDRHESLRTSLDIVDGEPKQIVHKNVPFSIENHELEDNRQGEQRERCINGIIKKFIRTFELNCAPLLRVGLIKIPAAEQYILMTDMHHIISDGISTNLLVKEFIAIYQGGSYPPLRIQYKDFAVRQNTAGGIERTKQQEAYWLKRLEGELPILNLPTDYPRPAIQSLEGEKYNFQLNPKETTILKQTAVEHEATIYMVLMAALDIILMKLSGQEDIIVGTPTAGRRHSDLEQIIGMFVNTLVLRNHPTGDKNFPDFMREVKKTALGAFENQDYPFEELVEIADVQRDAGRNPIFDVMLSMGNFNTTNIESEIPGLTLTPFYYETKNSKFDMTWNCRENNRQLDVTVTYSAKLFKSETIKRMTRYFKTIIAGLEANPGQKLAAIEMITAEEKRLILETFNDTATEYPEEKTLHQLFREQAEKTPTETAVIYETRQLTYD